jgi:hypothetical protein
VKTFGALGALLTLSLVSPALAARTPAQQCETAASSALGSCVVKVGAQTRNCYIKTGQPCAATDNVTENALSKLRRTVLGRCRDATTVQAAGFGALATPAALADRLAEACSGNPATIAARTFGGPQGALLAGADAATKSCLGTAAFESVKLVRRVLKTDSACILKARQGKSCDVSDTGAKVSAAESKTVQKITAACPSLATIVGLDPTTLVTRASGQARCMVATSHGDSGPLTLDCGPRASVPVPARGEWAQVVLDEATYGTRCGDGTSYAFWVHLAPEGSPVDRVVVDMEGGGVCLFESDCQSASAVGLLSALDESAPTTGYQSDDPSNPFANWTRVFLPYCTQDVHIGGGGQSVFPSITVNRFGGVNVRASLGYVRDLVWTVLEADGAAGYRPDTLQALFAGESAGAYGANYNYHWVLDDLRWAHTTAAPDAGLALDNGTAVSVLTFGTLVIANSGIFAWNVGPMLPSYCNEPACAVGPNLQTVNSVRLKAVPEQQILNISNQVDDAQVSTTFFTGPTATVDWINKLRTAYCATKGLKGIHYWLAARTASYHTILQSALYDSQLAGGITVRDWLGDAVVNPDGVTDRVDEGTLVTDYPGVNPIACLPGSPSGAFLD